MGGCCAGDDLYYCDETMVLKKVTCPNGCGWDEDKGFYNCDREGADPSGELQRECP